MELNGKKVFEEWDPALPIGTLYTSEVVDDFMNCLPPACLTSRCAQLGEPYSHEYDSKAGRFRPVFITFTRATSGKNGIWKYCGKCFQGEIEEPAELKTSITPTDSKNQRRLVKQLICCRNKSD